MHHFQLSGMNDIAFAAADLPQDGFCDVVLGGAQAACRNDNSVLGKGIQEDRSNLFPVVPDGNHAFDMDAGLFQGPRELCRIGIYHLADQNFVTDGADNGVDHRVSEVCFSMSFNSLDRPNGRRLVSIRLAPASSSSIPSSGDWATPMTGSLPWHSSRV